MKHDLEHALLGGVADGTLRLAPWPALTVKKPEQPEERASILTPSLR